jgi:hypothetical protein
MACDTSIAGRVTDMLTARRVTFHTKAMFGGLCFMVNDKLCLGVMKAELMVRLDAVAIRVAPRGFTSNRIPGPG